MNHDPWYIVRKIHPTQIWKYNEHKYRKAVHTCTKKEYEKLWVKETIISTLHFCCPSASEVFKASHVINVVPPCSFLPSNHHYQQPRKYFLLLNFPSWSEAGPALAVCHESFPPPPHHNHSSFASRSLQLSGKLNFIILCSHRWY